MLTYSLFISDCHLKLCEKIPAFLHRFIFHSELKFRGKTVKLFLLFLSKCKKFSGGRETAIQFLYRTKFPSSKAFGIAYDCDASKAFGIAYNCDASISCIKAAR